MSCADGIITAMFARGEKFGQGTKPHVRFGRLPPTLQFIHLNEFAVEDIWKNMCLPSDLRYLNLCLCTDGKWNDSMSKHIDFHRLPRKMTELILNYSPCGGVFVFDGLPGKMRPVYIKVPKDSVQQVFVNYTTLPKSVKKLMLCTYYPEKVAKRVWVIGEPSGVNFKVCGNYVGFGKTSKYTKAFQDKLK